MIDLFLERLEERHGVKNKRAIFKAEKKERKGLEDETSDEFSQWRFAWKRHKLAEQAGKRSKTGYRVDRAARPDQGIEYSDVSDVVLGFAIKTGGNQTEEKCIDFKYISSLSSMFAPVYLKELNEQNNLYLLSLQIVNSLADQNIQLPLTKEGLDSLIDTEGLAETTFRDTNLQRQILSEYGVKGNGKLVFLYRPVEVTLSYDVAGTISQIRAPTKRDMRLQILNSQEDLVSGADAEHFYEHLVSMRENS